jgi:hypothetical protein
LAPSGAGFSRRDVPILFRIARTIAPQKPNSIFAERSGPV